MKKQMAEVLLRTGDTISGRSAAVPLGNGRRQLRIKLPKQLTTRQYAALVCLGEGLTHKEIQVKLNMTPYMVKNSVSKLIRKAGLRRGTDFGRKCTVGDFLRGL